MIETVRWFLVDRALERGCRFMITLNLLDNMRVDLVFNGLHRHPQRILGRERRARAVSDDANSVHAQQRTPAVFFVIRFSMDGPKCLLGQSCSHRTLRIFLQLVFEPGEYGHCNGFRCFQNDVAATAAPVCPALTMASAWPCLTRSTARLTEESFLRRTASTARSLISTTCEAWTISTRGSLQRCFFNSASI